MSSALPLILAGLALSGPPAQAGDPLKPMLHLCTEDRDNPPYFSPSGQGSLLALVRQTAAQLDTGVEFHFLPWKRCLAMVAQGALDGALALVWTQERAAAFAFPLESDGTVDARLRLWQVEYPVYTHLDSPLAWDGQQFFGLTGALGTPRGYISEERLLQMQLPVQNFTPESGLKLVAKQRLAGYIIERQIGQALLARTELKYAVRELVQPFMSVPWYLVFSHRHHSAQPEQAARFWAELARQRDLAREAPARALP